MKKFVCIGLFTFLTFSQIIAQSRPIMGYDQVEWGVPVQEVRRVYNIGNEISLRESTDNPGRIFRLVQENVSDTIGEREFYFLDDRLYRVTVYYRNTSDVTRNNLANVLENRFGLQTGQIRQSGNIRIEYGRYSPDLLVELVYGPRDLWVTYTWKQLRDEFQASRLGL